MPLLDIFWTTILIFAWVMWFMLLFRVYGDLFSRHDIGGLAKTGWVVFTLFLPFLGVFVYLISQGRGMGERAIEGMQRQRDALDAHIRAVAADARTEQVTTAGGLPQQRGTATGEEHDRMVPSGS
jgi:Phospholipase_D-nuclease N-terminal